MKQKNYQSVYLSLFAIVTIWLAGQALGLIAWTKPDGAPIPVSLVQGNIPQELKWSPEHVNLSFERYVSLTEPLWGKNKLIIWPEAAIPLPLQYAPNFIQAMDNKARESGSELIMGIPVRAANGNGYYNAVVSVGNSKDAYLKRRLVPFGEYIPFPALISRFFLFMNVPMNNMLPGTAPTQPLFIDGLRILTFICYEIAFPEQVLSRDKNIGLLLTVTNDAWFGHSNAQAQHLEMAKMRAIESGRPLLFVSNDGITAIIGRNGQVLSSAPPFQSYVLSGMVQPAYGLTPWQRFAMGPLLMMLMCFITIAILEKRYVSNK